jgi:hypothetical protein
MIIVLSIISDDANNIGESSIANPMIATIKANT